MPDRFKTVYRGGQGEIVEKKSRFIASIAPAESEEQALTFLEETRKKYWDARHNCYACVIGRHREITRSSDDGEPSGTAGRPMLEVLLGWDLYDTVVVVTRYFGGTLLGTGGLVRAYTAAVNEGLRNSQVVEKIRAVRLQVITDYAGIGRMQYLAAEQEIPILHTEYTETVTMELLAPSPRLAQIQKSIAETTGGQAKMKKLQEVYYAAVDQRYQIWNIS